MPPIEMSQEEAIHALRAEASNQRKTVKGLEKTLEKIVGILEGGKSAPADAGTPPAASQKYGSPTIIRRYAEDIVSSLIGERIERRAQDHGIDRNNREQFDGYTKFMRGGDETDTRGLSMMRMSKALAAEKLGCGSPQDYLRSLYGQNSKIHDERAMDALKHRLGIPDVTRTLQAGDMALGGGFIPDDYWAEMVPLLRDIAVVRSAGAQTIPIPRGNLTIPKQTGAGTAYWEGESVDVAQSNQTTGQVQLQAKRLGALTAASRDLIMSSAIAVDQFIRNDLLYTMALTEDYAFLFGNGTSTSPILGLYNMPNTTTLTLATNGAVPDGDTPARAIQLAMQNFSRFIRPAWLHNSRTWLGFYQARSTTNQYYFRDQMDKGLLMGHPFFRSEQIPSNITTGSATNTSPLIFADMSTVIIGEQEGILVNASTDASYLQGASLVSSFTRGEVVILVERRVDMVCVQQPTVVIVKGLLPL